jgi:bifunctional non-homologous end joining protein LigD
MAVRKVKATFIQPMLLQRREHLPQGADWMYELKPGRLSKRLRSKRRVKCGCRSRNDNDFSHRYPSIVKALARLPNETVVDGEVLALDQSGKPSFNALQNYDSSQPEIFFYVFDLLILAGRNVMPEPLSVRRTLLEERVLPKLHEPIRYSAELGAALPVLISSVKAQGLEGVVAKRRRGAYEPGLRTGSWLKWLKMPVNQGQEFVIGGYTLSDKLSQRHPNPITSISRRTDTCSCWSFNSGSVGRRSPALRAVGGALGNPEMGAHFFFATSYP